MGSPKMKNGWKTQGKWIVISLDNIVLMSFCQEYEGQLQKLLLHAASDNDPLKRSIAEIFHM